MKKKEITLQDIFNQNNELYKNLVDCIKRLEEKINNSKPESVEQEQTTEIQNTEYVTITADDVYVGGEPATKYHGEDIYRPYMCVAYFKEARDIIREEYGYELKAIHCLQSSTEGDYAEPGNPIPDKEGIYSWVRCVYLDRDGKSVASRWVFNFDGGSASICASYCTYYCGYYVQYYEAMRAGLFGSVSQ